MGQGKRILVVDDNEDSADSLAMLLRVMGYTTRTAYDGIQAINTADEFRPELIFMDVAMPGLNGLEATRCIREKPWGSNIIVIALTGWGLESDQHQTREAGCDYHLVKPVDPAEIEHLLAEL